MWSQLSSVKPIWFIQQQQRRLTVSGRTCNRADQFLNQTKTSPFPGEVGEKPWENPYSLCLGGVFFFRFFLWFLFDRVRNWCLVACFRFSSIRQTPQDKQCDQCERQFEHRLVPRSGANSLCIFYASCSLCAVLHDNRWRLNIEHFGNKSIISCLYLHIALPLQAMPRRHFIFFYSAPTP